MAKAKKTIDSELASMKKGEVRHSKIDGKIVSLKKGEKTAPTLGNFPKRGSSRVITGAVRG